VGYSKQRIACYLILKRFIGNQGRAVGTGGVMGMGGPGNFSSTAAAAGAAGDQDKDELVNDLIKLKEAAQINRN